MNNINVLGVDLAKSIFQIHAEDDKGTVLFNRSMNRTKFTEFINKLDKPCLIGMEACGSAHHWGRTFEALGHTVKLMNPRRIKAYVVRNKTDARDAEAICEAAQSKKVLAVPVKSVPKQSLTSLHRVRSLIVKQRTQGMNALRAQLAESGLIAPRGIAPLNKLVCELLSDEDKRLSEEQRFFVQDMLEGWNKLSERVLKYDKKIKQMVKDSKSLNKLQTLQGIGPLTASAIEAKVEDFKAFPKGSIFASWLGLTPSEHSSANKRHLGSISKQGDRYLRTLLIHGARSSIRATKKKSLNHTAYHRWINSAVERLGFNKAAVALANKHARMIWAMMVHDRELDLNFSEQFSS